MNDINRSDDKFDEELNFNNDNNKLNKSDDSDDELDESDNKTLITSYMRLSSPTDMMREEYDTLDNLIKTMQDHADN